MNRFLIAAPAALIFTIATLAGATPVMARESGCVAAPQVRSAAASAQPDQARKALGYLATAEKLCDAGNDRAGKAKLEVAMKTLGLTETAQAATTPAAGQ